MDWRCQPLIPVSGSALNCPAAGVLGFQNDGGFYLLHSTPNFPDDPAFKKGQYQGVLRLLKSASIAWRVFTSSHDSWESSCVVCTCMQSLKQSSLKRACAHGTGINDCTAPKKGEPKCGPTDGQVKFGQVKYAPSVANT